ncbi:MAG: hypothetical protein WCK65_10430, partial [Rhodospirillaceae bacterium]
MNTPDQLSKIALVSLSLPDDKLLKVLELVEKFPDRTQAQLVLDQIRPRLVQLRPPRQVTAQRLLFHPVDDLFDPPEKY